jgi:DNA-binding Xre family transcriptional regulator
MKVRWKIAHLMHAKDWTNAHQLAAGAGISYPVAKRIWQGAAPDRVDFNTLGKLAKAFGCRRNPWKLLEIVSLD